MLNLANWIRSRAPVGRKAAELYGSIVTQSREPTFYRDLDIPDTPSGRYEVLVLHMAIVLHRLNAIEKPDGPLSRALTEAFVADIDDSLREMAFGDMSVPRRVKKAAAGLMERALAYRVAFEADDRNSVTALLSEFLSDLGSEQAKLIADYACRAASALPAGSQERQHLDCIGLFPVILQHAD